MRKQAENRKDAISEANAIFNDLINSNYPFDQILVEFEMTEEVFQKLTETSTINYVFK